MATMVMGQEMEQMQARSGGARAGGISQRNRSLYEQQLSRRRGPTPEMFFTKHIDNSRIVKADDPERRKEMRSFTIVMTLFFALMMVYVWQHFTAIEVGYKIEAQKLQVEQMREQNRQLLLEQAQLSDPGRIDRIAKDLGLSEPAPGQVVQPEAEAGAVFAQVQAPTIGTR